MLGDISRKYESGNLGPGAVVTTPGDPGGTSYGAYQMAINTGTVHTFIKRMNLDTELYKNFVGLKIGSKAFNQMWIKTASEHPKEFLEAQHNFIKRSHFAPLRTHANYLSIPDHPAINEVLFSMGVQHGGAKKILESAGIEPGDSFEIIIKKLYAARTKYVKGLNLKPNIIKALVNRYRQEEQDVLSLL